MERKHISLYSFFLTGYHLQTKWTLLSLANTKASNPKLKNVETLKKRINLSKIKIRKIY